MGSRLCLKKLITGFPADCPSAVPGPLLFRDFCACSVPFMGCCPQIATRLLLFHTQVSLSARPFLAGLSCGIVISAAAVETVWRFLRKLKMELPFDPAVPLLGSYPKKTKTLSPKGICTPMFTVVLLVIGKIRKQSGCPSVGEYPFKGAASEVEEKPGQYVQKKPQEDDIVEAE